MLVESWLPALGYVALYASTSAQGRTIAARESVDLILLDLMLPDVSGLGHLAAFRREFPTIPVILMTAHGSERVAVEAFQLGARNYLIKPFVLDHLKHALEEALRERRLQHEKEQLAAELEQRVADLTVLNTIGRAITTEIEPEAVLRRIVEAALQVTRAEESFLLLREGERLVVRAAKTAGDERAQVLRLPTERGVAHQVLQQRRPLRTMRPTSEHPVKVKTGYLVRSLLLVPIIAQDLALGILGVDNAINPQAFTEAQEHWLAALADYAAIALENSRLFSASQRTEARYRDLFTNANDVLLLLDERLNVVEVNAAGPKLLGYTSDEIVGQSLRWLTLPQQSSAVETRLRELMAAHEGQAAFELDLRKWNGQLVKVEVYARNVLTADGERRVFCALRDLTERLQLEAQVIQSAKLAAMEQMIAGIAHELNNPLASITGYGQLLLRDNTLPPEAQQDVARIVDQAQRAGQIVQQLLSFGRSAELARTAVNLSTLIESTLALRSKHAWPATIAIVRELAANLPLVLGDPFQLQQVVLHLLDNALHAMTETSGTLTVSTFTTRDLATLSLPGPTTSLPAALRGPAVVAAIRDTGVGIPAHQLSSIFDPFWTTKEVGDGPGLGLSVCYGIVSQHAGQIWASSEVGRGTTVYLALPPKPLLPQRPTTGT